MVMKIYAFAWLLAAVSVALLYFAGRLNEPELTVLGFILSTLFFTGVVAILPWWVDKLHAPKYRIR